MTELEKAKAEIEALEKQLELVRYSLNCMRELRRERFMCAALTGLMSHPELGTMPNAETARMAQNQADACMAVLEGKDNENN